MPNKRKSIAGRVWIEGWLARDTDGDLQFFDTRAMPTWAGRYWYERVPNGPDYYWYTASGRYGKSVRWFIKNHVWESDGKPVVIPERGECVGIYLEV